MSSLEIINRALTNLGSAAASALTDTAKNAARAITAYPLCRDEILRAVPWPSCSHRALLKNMDSQACPWTASRAYLLGDRVTNDTAKTYRCTTAGVAAAATGPTGTGTAITDGTVIWTYVEASTALNNWVHVVSTAYVLDDLVTYDNAKVYVCVVAGTTAAATPPTGVTKTITDGTVTWDYYGTPPHNRTVYSYQYVLPPDCLRVLKIPVIGTALESDQGVQYMREGKWLYCDQDDSFAKYTMSQEDPDQWDVLLQETVALKIAAEIAFDVTGQKDLAVLAYQKLTGAYAVARTVALNEGAEGTPEQVRWEDV